MSEPMEFGLLGPLLIRSGGAEIPIRRGHQRAFLALLLLEANQLVPTDQITEALWGSEPPASAPVSIRSCIQRLRAALGEAGRQRISTEPRGYLIHVADGELDVARFERLLAAARTAARSGSWPEAAEQAKQALSWWRGEPLADIESETIAGREVPRLAELRLQAVEIRIEAALRLGGDAEVIAELRGLCAAHPLREHLHALLMLALYRCGRQSEALAAYQRARAELVEELGIDPGAELSELHQRILSADPSLSVTEPARPRQAEHRRDVPRELPPTVPAFTGRSAELQALTGLLDRPGAQVPGTVVISAIGGTAGVGKTALAVHWAHQAAGRFPDGQLYVNLHGYDPGPPMPATDALAAFLRSLGMPGQDIPLDQDERAGRYRSLLAGRRVLVVLDNAGSADQVRPLLPGTPAAIVVVTSRDALAGLVARDGATRLDLDVLPRQDAVALLRTLIGARVAADLEAAGELADQCCRLPLALRVAAELAASRPAASLAELTGELADLSTRLDLLAADGDPRAQVRTVFSWSYRHLGTEAARTFRLLGLHPGPDADHYAAAALTGMAVRQSRQALDTLARAGLIQSAGTGRYGMHDLLRGYARELTATLDIETEQHTALTRLFDYYLHTAAAAMDSLYPAERHRRPRIPRPASPVPALADPEAAHDWLDRERATLVAVAGYTARDWPGHATGLATTLPRYLRNGGHFPEALTIFSHALGAARLNGDPAAEATTLNQIGGVNRQQGHLQEAAEQYGQALTLFREAGDRVGEAQALSGIGITETGLGRYEQAAGHQQNAVAICRETGDRFGEARTLGLLGLARQRQGRYQEAGGYHQQTLDLSRELGDREGEAWALARLGIVDLRLGRYSDAVGYLQQALALFHQMSDKGGESEVLVRLGEVYLRLGRYEQAARDFEQVLAMSHELDDRLLEAEALNRLGDVLLQAGELVKAREHHTAALRLASETGSPLEQARAHSGLARACRADGDSPEALRHWQEALTRYDAIGAPEASEIRGWLDTTGDDSHRPAPEDRSSPAPAPG